MAGRSKLEILLVALAIGIAVLLVGEEIPRVLFPWDLKMFSETTLLTSMVKLSHGQSPYSDPSDVNSFIYAPALDYVTFGALRPFGLQLDVRACRAVCVVVGVAAAVVVAHLAARLSTLLSGAKPPPAMTFVAGVVAASIVFKSYTADACHPDDLYILHAMTVVALTWAAADKASYRVALAAVAVAAFGFTVKQTAVLGVLGATGVLLHACGPRWGARRSAALVTWGLAWTALGAWLVLRGWGRFWTITVPGHHELEWWRLYRILGHYGGQHPFRLMLGLAFMPCAFYVALESKTRPRLRSFLLVWAAIGATEILPSIVSYFKAYGFWNNLTIVDLWMWIPIFGVVVRSLRSCAEPNVHARRAMAGGAVATLLVALTPTRNVPTREEYAFGHALEEAIAVDKAAGRRVAVSQGLATMLRNGYLDVPRDKHNGGTELVIANLADFTATKSRFASHEYDKVYVLDAGGYSADVQAVIDANYRQIGSIPGVPPRPVDWDIVGNMSFMKDGVRIFEANR